MLSSKSGTAGVPRQLHLPLEQSDINNRAGEDGVGDVTPNLSWVPSAEDLSFADLNILQDSGNFSLSTWV